MTKSILLIQILTLFSSLTFAQYIPLIEDNKYWIYENFFEDESNNTYSVISGNLSTFEGDTLIGNQTYSFYKVYALDGEDPCLNSYSYYAPADYCFEFSLPYTPTYKSSFYELIREDTFERKVYRLPQNGNPEELILDFSLQVGDTLPDYIYDQIVFDNMNVEEQGIINAIDTQYIEGKNRLVFHTIGIPPMFGLLFAQPIEIIEGLGFNGSVFVQRMPYDYCTGCMIDLTISLNETFDFGINISPNPTADKLFINSEKPFNKCVLYNSQGKIEIEQKESKLHLNELASGIYYLKIIYDDNKVFTQKIMKQ